MKYLFIDGNSIGFSSQASSKLHNGNGDEIQAVFGFIRGLRSMMIDRPEYEPIVFWDGRSWRYDVFPAYKEGREKDPKQAAEREAYKKQRPIIGRVLTHLGVEQRVASNMEADDLIARATWELTEHDEAVIVSGDRDLLQLVTPNASWLNPIRLPGGKRPSLLFVTYESFAEDTGYETPVDFLKGKAFLGDASDNLQGIDGIGAKAAPMVVKSFPNINEMISDIRLRGDAAIPPHLSRYKKKLKDFAGSAEAHKRLARNIRLMSLMPARLPEPINYRAIKPTANMTNFRKFCAENDFASILREFDEWTAPFAGYAEAA